MSRRSGAVLAWQSLLHPGRLHLVRLLAASSICLSTRQFLFLTEWPWHLEHPMGSGASLCFAFSFVEL